MVLKGVGTSGAGAAETTTIFSEEALIFDPKPKARVDVGVAVESGSLLVPLPPTNFSGFAGIAPKLNVEEFLLAGVAGAAEIVELLSMRVDVAWERELELRLKGAEELKFPKFKLDEEEDGLLKIKADVRGVEGRPGEKLNAGGLDGVPAEATAAEVGATAGAESKGENAAEDVAVEVPPCADEVDIALGVKENKDGDDVAPDELDFGLNENPNVDAEVVVVP